MIRINQLLFKFNQAVSITDDVISNIPLKITDMSNATLEEGMKNDFLFHGLDW